MKVLGNGARTNQIETRPIEISRKKERYNHMNFTIYRELYSEYVAVKIICDRTSEVVFSRNLYDEDCFEYLDDEAFHKVLEHTEAHITEIDKLYSQLLEWKF
ncbi:hypothetical protein BFS35_011175 [Macrococcoides goetzii]|uniref:DUF1108 family protein n=1 Tax=Macrococcoides goetzii TaxID=1891097 RepID=A0A2G5NUZ9_9STAP|nr:hypothetical protein [Macrococcus goetzii]RAI79700.1 hypothetical protein BFS35_011175 [Macrococcus goetzii]